MILAPEMLGDTIRETADSLLAHERKASPSALLYAEKPGGFQCRTCKFSVPLNAIAGRCAIMTTTISLDNGCCAAWMPDTKQLHLYQEKDDA